jgi:SAM-dependent methyltransferase
MVDGSTGGSSRWLKLIDVDEQYGRHVIQKFVGEISAVDVACDLGVGQGSDLGIVRSKFPKSHCHGIDFTTTNATKLLNSGIELHQMDLERDLLPFGNQSTDLIVANQVYEHLKEIFWVSHEVSRTLKVGGHLIIGVPNICALHNRIRFLAGVQPTQMKSYSAHIRGFGPNEIPKFLEVCFPGGYKLRGFTGAQFYPFPKKISRSLSRLAPSFSQSVFYLFEKRLPYVDQFLQHPELAQLETKFFVG